MKFLENLSIKGKIRLITLPLIGIAVVEIGRASCRERV